MKPSWSTIAFVTIAVVGVLSVVLLSAISQSQLSPDTASAANDYPVQLTLVQPADAAGAQVGDTFVLAIDALLPDPDQGDNPNVAELVLNYDPAVLSGTSVDKGDSSMLALNDNIDNTGGQMTIDVANGNAGAFVGVTRLATFTFTVQSVPHSTTATIDNSSTLGYPNGLDYANSTMSLELALDPIVCGDGTVEGSEVCDSDSLSCTTGEGYAGNQSCLPDCSAYGSCVSADYCGDGTVNGNEVCDGDTASCTTANGYDGTQGCLGTCAGYGSCASAEYCGDDTVNGNELCDDGNNDNYDACAGDCAGTCGTDEVWVGTRCVPVGCRGDFNRDEIVNIGDFSTFGQNYKTQGIDCSLDLVGDDCELTVQDFSKFAAVYRETDACTL